MKFKIYEDQAGLFRWSLVRGNGKIIADSGQGYASRRGATVTAKRLIAHLEYYGAEVVQVRPKRS